MLDEPFSGVDPIAVSEIQQHISNLRKSGLAILITDHNVRETLEIVDRAYLIFDGRVESQGTREFLINDPISRQLYLGERFRMYPSEEALLLRFIQRNPNLACYQPSHQAVTEFTTYLCSICAAELGAAINHKKGQYADKKCKSTHPGDRKTRQRD